MRNIIWGISALLLVSYLVFIFIWMGMESNVPKCTGIEIKFDTSVNNSFVTADEVSREIGYLPDYCVGMPLDQINTDSLERILNSIDKIEKASCVTYSTGRIEITVTPMHPVVRVFDGNISYYLNSQGKRIEADARYHMDVPVIKGSFDATHPAIDLLPLVNYIQADSLFSGLISMIEVDKKGEITLVPMLKGHVIKFGANSNIENKFDRLHRFYTEVLKYRGWETYETIAVKWDGQIVATKRKKKSNEKVEIERDLSETEVPDVESMQVKEENPDNLKQE
ncbi:MAG: hypothetical protein IKZ14_07480 [Muribaculaceae bacterium]|nr:hypothetical protein [Muribaculaceae bacterium]